MSDSTQSECPVAIFCGGEHSRMGRLGTVQAKTLLIARETPLLWRLIDQLRAAGFSRIVAATTPRLERCIRESTDEYVRAGGAELDVKVLASPEQERGIAFGLARFLAVRPPERCLVCLGDIFFLGNPFPAFHRGVASEFDCLGVAPLALEEERRFGGLVHEEGGKVLAIVERPGPDMTGNPFRWSGTALFDARAAREDLEIFLAEASADAPLGDFFEFQRGRGRDLRCIPGPDFVNVNSPDQLLLASLYARLEADSDDRSLSESLTDAANALRRGIARRPGREED